MSSYIYHLDTVEDDLYIMWKDMIGGTWFCGDRSAWSQGKSPELNISDGENGAGEGGNPTKAYLSN